MELPCNSKCEIQTYTHISTFSYSIHAALKFFRTKRFCKISQKIRKNTSIRYNISMKIDKKHFEKKRERKVHIQQNHHQYTTAIMTTLNAIQKSVMCLKFEKQKLKTSEFTGFLSNSFKNGQFEFENYLVCLIGSRIQINHK